MKNAILYCLLSLIIIGCNNNAGRSNKVVADSLPQDRLNIDSKDSALLIAVTEGSMLERALGRYASGHATDQRLKDYGYRMIEDHTHLLDGIKNIAASRNVILQDTLTPGNRQLILSLGVKGGNRFDSSYMAEIIAHQKMLASLYDKVSATTTDTALKNYSKETVTLIMDHLMQLVTLRDSINIKKK